MSSACARSPFMIVLGGDFSKNREIHSTTFTLPSRGDELRHHPCGYSVGRQEHENVDQGVIQRKPARIIRQELSF